MKIKLLIIIALASLQGNLHSNPQEELTKIYNYHCQTPSDIYQHIPVLKELAQQCSSVIEIGIRYMVSSWGIFEGLAHSPFPNRSYLGIDLAFPPKESFDQAKSLAEQNGITFNFLQANDMDIELEQADMLFIDSLHTYCHLTYELETFSPKIRKFITMHDTSAPWGNQDDDQYTGDYSEYPAQYDRYKRGLWPAVEDFLKRHPEWTLQERRLNNHGFTILRRVSF